MNAIIIKRLDHIASAAALLAVGLLLAVAVANLAGYEQGLLGQLAHFPVHDGVLALMVSLWLSRRHRWISYLSLVLATGFFMQVAWLWKPPFESSVVSKALPVRLLSFNVYQANRQFDRVIDALQKADPDVPYLTELTPDWRQAIAPLRSKWPHSIGDGANLLLSRLPLEKARSIGVTFERASAANRLASDSPLPMTEVQHSAWPESEMLFATAHVGERRLDLVGMHLPTPRSRQSLLAQRAAGLVAAQEISAISQPQAVVVLGDLNNSCFSPTFRFLKEHTFLRDSAQGFGHSPTWGPRLPREPWLPWLGTAIDHVLVSQNITVRQREVGPPLGSDHRWVYVEVVW